MHKYLVFNRQSSIAAYHLKEDSGQKQEADTGYNCGKKLPCYTPRHWHLAAHVGSLLVLAQACPVPTSSPPSKSQPLGTSTDTAAHMQFGNHPALHGNGIQKCAGRQGWTKQLTAVDIATSVQDSLYPGPQTPSNDNKAHLLGFSCQNLFLKKF